MSAEIITVSSDKILKLLNSQGGRMPVYAGSWTKMRIGVRFCLPAVAALPGSPKLVIGVCSGPAGPSDAAYANASTTNFCGVKTNTSNWTFAGTPGTNGYFGAIDWRVIKRIGTTETAAGADIGSGGNNYHSANEGKRSVVILQIEKGSPNYTFRLVSPANGSAAQHDVTDTELLEFMESPDDLGTPSDIVANYSKKITNNTIAMDEVPGALDHINIYWAQTSIPFYLSDLYHRLLA